MRWLQLLVWWYELVERGRLLLEVGGRGRGNVGWSLGGLWSGCGQGMVVSASQPMCVSETVCKSVRW